jgi:hypothetical protein
VPAIFFGIQIVGREICTAALDESMTCEIDKDAVVFASDRWQPLSEPSLIWPASP